MDDNQLDEIKTRRQDELEALQAFYGHQLRSSLPNSLSPPHHHGGGNDDDSTDEISLNGPWFIELLDTSSITTSGGTSKYYKIPTLEIRLPPHYPLSSTSRPTPILHHVDSNLLLTSLQKQSLIEELVEMYEPDMDMAILWAERCREEFLDVDVATVFLTTAGNDTATSSVNGATVNQNDTTNNCNTDQQQQQQQQSPSTIRFLSFNHLLYGKSHKKESQIVSLASKLGLLGFIVYGTPGIIGLVTTVSSNNNEHEEEDVVLLEFAKDCSNRIGKKATILEFEVMIAPNGGLLSSSSRDGAVVDDAAEGKRTKSNATTTTTGEKNKSSSSTKNKKSKSKAGNDNKGNSNSASGGSSSSTPLLVNLLGDDRVTITTNDTISKKKSGLRQFDSLAELKEVLPGDVVQSILGL